MKYCCGRRSTRSGGGRTGRTLSDARLEGVDTAERLENGQGPRPRLFGGIRAPLGLESAREIELQAGGVVGEAELALPLGGLP